MNTEMKKIIRDVGVELGFKESTITRTINSLCRYYSFNSNPVDICDLTKTEAKDIHGINVNGGSWKLVEEVKVVLKEKLYLTVFLSHPMNGLTEEEIFEIRDKAVKHLERKYDGKKINVIDNVHHWDAPANAGRLWHLGESIKMMNEADGVYFCPGWMNAKGCQIEYEVCKTYGLVILD